MKRSEKMSKYNNALRDLETFIFNYTDVNIATVDEICYKIETLKELIEMYEDDELISKEKVSDLITYQKRYFEKEEYADVFKELVEGLSNE